MSLAPAGRRIICCRLKPATIWRSTAEARSSASVTSRRSSRMSSCAPTAPRPRLATPCPRMGQAGRGVCCAPRRQYAACCAAAGADRRRAVGDGLWAFVTNGPHALQWPRPTARRRFAVRPDRWAPARLPVHQTTSLSNAIIEPGLLPQGRLQINVELRGIIRRRASSSIWPRMSVHEN
jgi:hypothetical protein